MSGHESTVNNMQITAHMIETHKKIEILYDFNLMINRV